MATSTSTLDPDNIPERDRQLGTGHGTSALGPSDISDSGSDVQTGRRIDDPDTELHLDRGTTEDPDHARHDASAGPDLGDAGLDSDSDSAGTGERATAARDTDIEAGTDIDIDRVDEVDAAGVDEVDDDQGDLFAPRMRHPNRPQPSRR